MNTLAEQHRELTAELITQTQIAENTPFGPVALRAKQKIRALETELLVMSADISENTNVVSIFSRAALA